MKKIKRKRRAYFKIFLAIIEDVEEMFSSRLLQGISNKEKMMNGKIMAGIKEANDGMDEAPGMTFKEYQASAFSTALETAKNTSYMVMGLCGESGEIANKSKKVIRDNKDWNREDLISELGDVLWYVAGMATLHNIELQEIANKNIEKLFSRKERGVIQGSGDNR